MRACVTQNYANVAPAFLLLSPSNTPIQWAAKQHEALSLCSLAVGPPSATLAQRQANIGGGLLADVYLSLLVLLCERSGWNWFTAALLFLVEYIGPGGVMHAVCMFSNSSVALGQLTSHLFSGRSAEKSLIFFYAMQILCSMVYLIPLSCCCFCSICNQKCNTKEKRL